jgi:hypothetical protein
MITWGTNSLWDHYEFWFDEELIAAAIAILKAHAMPFWGFPTEGGYLGAHAGKGIQFRPLNYCTPTREKRYKVPCTDAQFEAFVVNAFAKIGTPYNYEDIAGLLFHNRKLTPESREICSEFGFEQFARAAVWMLNSEIDYAPLVTPEMLHLSPLWMRHCEYSFPSV